MPVLVVGADTDLGSTVIDALTSRDGEVRAFVSSPEEATTLRGRGIKVALGDVSDGSHVGGAALNCFSVVLIAAAAEDDRERSFARTPAEVFEAWAEALEMAVPRRVIWVGRPGIEPVDGTDMEMAIVETADRSAADIAAEIARLDDQETLSE